MELHMEHQQMQTGMFIHGRNWKTLISRPGLSPRHQQYQVIEVKIYHEVENGMTGFEKRMNEEVLASQQRGEKIEEEIEKIKEEALSQGKKIKAKIKKIKEETRRLCEEGERQMAQIQLQTSILVKLLEKLKK